MRRQLEETPILGQRDQVLFAGGSVWALVTIMKPETALDQFPKLTVSDIRAYTALLSMTPGKYPEIDFTSIADADARKIAEADYARICGTAGGTPVFKPEELQAGAALLEQVSVALSFSERVVRFDRKAVTAWITARITPAEHRHLLPGAFGRAIPDEGWPVEPPVAEVPDVTPPKPVQPRVAPKEVPPQTSATPPATTPSPPPSTPPSTPLRPVPELTPSVVGGNTPSQPGSTVPCGVVPMAPGGFCDGECGSCRSCVGLTYVWPTIRFSTPRCDTCSGCSPCHSESGVSSRWSATCCVPCPTVCQTIVGIVETASPSTIPVRSLPQLAGVQLVPRAAMRLESPSPETLAREYQKQGRSAGDLYVVGMSAFRKKNYAVAVSYFSAATLLTNDARCWHFRGLCERELGRLADAERSVAYGWQLTAADSESRSRAYLALEEVQGKRRAWLEGTKDSTNQTLTAQSSR